MKKFDWNHPVTRKDYAILCGWSMSIVMVFYTIWIGALYWDEIKDWTEKSIRKIRAKLPW